MNCERCGRPIVCVDDPPNVEFHEEDTYWITSSNDYGFDSLIGYYYANEIIGANCFKEPLISQ